MPSSGLTVTGGKRLIRKLDMLAKTLPDEAEAAGEEILDMLFLNMPDYPPAIPGSRYVRTYNLFDAVRSRVGEHEMSLSDVEVGPDSVVVSLGVSDYGPYVVGLVREQSRIHRGRWWKLSDVVRNNVRDAVRIAESHVRKSIRTAGF